MIARWPGPRRRDFSKRPCAPASPALMVSSPEPDITFARTRWGYHSLARSAPRPSTIRRVGDRDPDDGSAPQPQRPDASPPRRSRRRFGRGRRRPGVRVVVLTHTGPAFRRGGYLSRRGPDGGERHRRPAPAVSDWDWRASWPPYRTHPSRSWPASRGTAWEAGWASRPACDLAVAARRPGSDSPRSASEWRPPSSPSSGAEIASGRCIGAVSDR